MRRDPIHTPVPGVSARHTVITDTCRTNRGDLGAWEEAVARLRAAYVQALPAWPVGTEVEFHLALTVCTPRHRGEGTAPPGCAECRDPDMPSGTCHACGRRWGACAQRCVCPEFGGGAVPTCPRHGRDGPERYRCHTGAHWSYECPGDHGK